MDTLDALLRLPTVYSAEISHDGQWAAWELAGPHPTTTIYAAPTDGSQPPRRLTGDDQQPHLWGWHPRERAVIIAQDNDGDERFQLFMVSIDEPMRPVRLTEPDPRHFTWGGEMHPTKDLLFYSANIDPTDAPDTDHHRDEDTTTDTYQVIRHDLQMGERTALTHPERPCFFEPELSPDGRRVLYTRNDSHPAARHLWMVNSDGTADREVYNPGTDKKCFGRWMSDSRHIALRVETNTHYQIGVLDSADGTVRWLLDDPARNIEGLYAPRGTEKLLLYEIVDTRLIGILLDPETGEESRFADSPGNVVPLRPVDDGGDWLCIHYSATQPRDLVRLAPNGQMTSIAGVWEQTDLTPDDFTPAEDFRWQSVDGLPVQGWLFRAQGDTVKGTIIHVHGGPTAHVQDMIRADIQYFTQQGFNVLAPNYRGSTGFSLEFRQAIIETGWGGLEQEDIRSGIQALIDAGIAQPGKVGVTGTSYGGYSSWHAITHFDTATVAAAAPICGMTDLVSDYYNTRPDLRPYSEEMIGGKPDDVPERYHERSPVNFVGNIEGPVLIVQGMQDTNVTPAQVNAVTQALQAAAVEYGTLAFDDEGHGVYKRENKRRLYAELARFFGEAFGG
jgi:dipeptidyl aminopeptidase/acylaminoacyl peptidase